jgi:hypothetical protein
MVGQKIGDGSQGVLFAHKLSNYPNKETDSAKNEKQLSLTERGIRLFFVYKKSGLIIETIMYSSSRTSNVSSFEE